MARNEDSEPPSPMLSLNVMINIFSIKCGIAFAPYFIEAASGFLSDKRISSRVVRQAGSGLIISSQDGISLRFQNREATLDAEDARHYLATVKFRSEFYDVARLSDEVVIANIGRSLLLSHPQSDLWLEIETVADMLVVFDEVSAVKSKAVAPEMPDWLNLSTAAGRLLVSDQRNGRWVLLGADHKAELQRRLALLEASTEPVAPPGPPVITLKNLTIRLQSAFKLAETLEAFAESGELTPYEEATPVYTLRVARATEGIELSDSNGRVLMTAKEARKWVSIIKAELTRLNAEQVERGNIRTVFADGEGGRWVAQWGDEVLITDEALSQIGSLHYDEGYRTTASVALKTEREFLLLLARHTGACVALTESEKAKLLESRP